MRAPSPDFRALHGLRRLPAQNPDTACRDHAFALWKILSAIDFFAESYLTFAVLIIFMAILPLVIFLKFDEGDP